MMLLSKERIVIFINILKAREELKYGKSIFDMNLRVVYYARVSTEKDEQLNSLENQKKFFEDYIGNSKNWKLIGNYIDEGISGTGVKNRTSFLKMINDAIDGKFDMIITKEVSRFARNTVDSIQYTDHLLKYGVIVNFLNDNLNTLDETCEFRLTIMSSLAQDEVRKLSSRVKFGMARSVKDGKVLGGGNITGYYKEKGKLYIDEKEAKMIRMLFDLYASGNYGFRKISKILYDNGFKNTKGKPYADRVLVRMIQNPKYKGYYCGNISYIEDYKTHKKVKRPKEEWLIYKDENIPAIVTEEIWDRANAIHESKKDCYEHSTSKRSYYDDRYTYTGMIVCKEHGCTFGRVSSGKRKSNPVWQCLEYQRSGLKGCQTPTLFEKHLDQIFKEIISEFISKKEDLLNLMLSDYQKFIYENNNENKISELDEKIKRTVELKNKLLELNLDGCISNIEFKNKNESYNNDIELYTKMLEDLKAVHKEEDIYKKRIDKLKLVLDKKLEFNNSFKDLFKLIVKKVYVSKIDNDRKHIKFEIFFNYDIEPKLIIKDFSNKKESKYKRSTENHSALEYQSLDTNRARC